MTWRIPCHVKFSFFVIQVFITYSTNEYDRCNDDVDPVSASAEYELEKRVELMDIFDVQLNKGRSKLLNIFLDFGVVII